MWVSNQPTGGRTRSRKDRPEFHLLYQRSSLARTLRERIMFLQDRDEVLNQNLPGWAPGRRSTGKLFTGTSVGTPG